MSPKPGFLDDKGQYKIATVFLNDMYFHAADRLRQLDFKYLLAGPGLVSTEDRLRAHAEMASIRLAQADIQRAESLLGLERATGKKLVYAEDIPDAETKKS